MFLFNTIKSGLQSIASGRRGGSTTVDSPRIIDWDAAASETHEQMRTHAGVSRVRTTPFTDNWTGETPEMRWAYRKSLSEPAVKAALLGKIISVCALDLQIDPKNKKDPQQHENAQLVKHCITSCKGGTPGLIWEILSGGLIDGWSICEKVWGREERGQYRGYRILKALKSKDTRFIQPEVDPYRNVIGLWNFRGNAGHRFDPADFVHFSYLSLFQNPCGMSDLRAAYRAIQVIPAVQLMRAVFLEKFIGPWMKGKVKTQSLKAKMLSELQQARAKGVIVLDEGSDVEVIDLATRGTADYQACLDDLRKEIATSVSGAFLHMMTGGGPEQRGNSEVQKETTEGFVWILSEQVKTVIQDQVIPDIVDHNLGSQIELPIATLQAVNPADILDDLKIDQMLVSLGLTGSREDTYDRARRSPPKNAADAYGGFPQQVTAPTIGAGGIVNPFAVSG